MPRPSTDSSRAATQQGRYTQLPQGLLRGTTQRRDGTEKSLLRNNSAYGLLPDNEELLRRAHTSARRGVAFTGERVIPGSVETQLWNEHVSRYRFACLFAKGKRVLDAACGAGYGASLLAEVGSHVVGVDLAAEALEYADHAFSGPDYLQASVTDLPLQSGSFDLITAFEVIEHLSDWHSLLEECARVLRPDGTLVLSTPNREYYAETRGPSGPNPFHVHEFTFEEFKIALERVFPFVRILAQNQQEAITFAGDWPNTSPAAFIPPAKNPDGAHFFVAVCGFQPIAVPAFSDVSSTRNLLREREQHVRALQEQLLSRDQELQDLQLRLRAVEEEQSQVKQSGWIRLGQIVGLGPWSDHRFRRRFGLASIRGQSISLIQFFWHLLRCIEIAFWVPFAAAVLGTVDLCFLIFGRKVLPAEKAPRYSTATIVIPNWNGADLLRANLPSVMKAAAATPGVEVMVVDNGSSDDSVAVLSKEFPEVRVVQLRRNQGFAAACNRGARIAEHDVVVFLNNDVRVEEDFLPLLLRNFGDPLLFAVASQILFTDPNKSREETGLTEVWWQEGQLHVGHRADPLIKTAFPCAYPGGGSSAFDRLKFIELGGFDSLFHPFYYEDTDLGYMAWKRGWKVLYEPASVVHHEHRGTIGRVFSARYVSAVTRKNALLYCWKNVHDWRLLATHFRSDFGNALRTVPENASVTSFCPQDIRSACAALGGVVGSRWQALKRKQLSDNEALRRPLGGYYQDRFLAQDEPNQERLNVLLVSPYAIEPATHGGAVFMREAVRALASVSNVHVISFVDKEDQLEAQKALLPQCRSAHFLVRPNLHLQKRWTLTPTGVREFGLRDFAWAINRTIFVERIDVVQLEYTIMGQYAGAYRNIPCILFEHDVSAQSLWRRIRAGEWNWDLVVEYLRMRVYEPKLLKQVTRVQVCSRENARYLARRVRGLRERVDSDMRATIDVASYEFLPADREPDSLLFVGCFRHLPNISALNWFIHEVFPMILAERPQTTLNVVGSDLPDALAAEWSACAGVRVVGEVPDIKAPLRRYSAFVCPVLSGSGVRVKLLEAFASGIPVVATAVGAEGLANEAVGICEIANSAPEFASATLRLLNDEEYRHSLAQIARRCVEQHRDSQKAITRLEAVYRKEVRRMRGWRSDSFHGALPDLRPQESK